MIEPRLEKRQIHDEIDREPIPDVDHDYGYRGEGFADRVARVLGFFGLAGLFLLNPRRSSRGRANRTPSDAKSRDR